MSADRKLEPNRVVCEASLSATQPVERYAASRVASAAHALTAANFLIRFIVFLLLDVFAPALPFRSSSSSPHTRAAEGLSVY